MSEASLDLVDRAVARDPDGVRELVRILTPVIQARVARAILRHHSTRRQNRSAAEEARDVTQEVFAALFADDARALRAWHPSRGSSLVSFVGLLAEHQVANIFRNGKRRPWSDDVIADPDLEAAMETEDLAERQIASREFYAALLDRLRAALSPRGFEIFRLIFIEERSVEAVCAETGMTHDAVYAWRSRLPRAARKVAEELEKEQASEGTSVTRAVATGADP